MTPHSFDGTAVSTQPQENHTDSETLFVRPHGALAISYIMYSWAIPIFLGLPGNILAIVVASRKHNRNLSPCIFMAAMGVVDTILLLDTAWTILMNSVLIKQGFLADPEFWLRLHIFLSYASGMLSGLFLAAMSVDRLIAVRFPMEASRLCTARKARITVVVMSLLILALNSYVFFAVKYMRDEVLGLNSIVLTVPGKPYLELLASGFQVVVGTVLPFIVIFGSNIVIIITLRRASKESRALTSNQNNRREKDTQYLTRMLLFVSFAYVIITLPYRMYHLLVKVPEIAAIYDFRDLYWKIRYIIQARALGGFWLMNNAINFYLYCIGGGQKYRNDAREIINMCFCSRA